MIGKPFTIGVHVRKRRAGTRRVESCWTIAPPLGPLRDAKGSWSWQTHALRVNYRVSALSSRLRLSSYHQELPIDQSIKLVRSNPNFGGVRWWFVCPRCARTVSKLHRPSNSSHFLCRDCHDLNYESAQISRTRAARLVRNEAHRLKTTTRLARLYILLNDADGQTVRWLNGCNPLPTRPGIIRQRHCVLFQTGI